MPSEKTLLDAVFLLNEQSAGPFHERLFEASRLLFHDVVHSFELWRKQDGRHESRIDIDYTGRDAVEIMQRVGELVPVEHPAYGYALNGGLAPVRLEDFVSHRQFRRTELYELAFRCVDIRHQMTLPLLTDTHFGALTINRKGNRQFDVEDVRLAALFARFVVQAFETDEVIARAKGEREIVDARDHLPLRRSGLTRRQSEVLHWIAQGKRDKEIALILGISHRTVTDHVHAILTKLGVETRTAAAAMVREP